MAMIVGRRRLGRRSRLRRHAVVELQHGENTCVVDTERHVVEVSNGHGKPPSVVHLQPLDRLARDADLASSVEAVEDGLSISWAQDGELPVAILDVCKASNTRKQSSFGFVKADGEQDPGPGIFEAADAWDAGWLDAGFVLDWKVRRDCAEMSELQIELDKAHWYGGGHMMAQYWPLEKAMWEVGPFLPFDNGPNGINTLIHPIWINSNGYAVVVQEDTPYLHVGMNSPKPFNGWGWNGRQWAVGVQNALQPLLPKQDDGNGDGLLHLQRRATYRDMKMQHPLALFGGSPMERFMRVADLVDEEQLEDVSRRVSDALWKVPLVKEFLQMDRQGQPRGGGEQKPQVIKEMLVDTFRQIVSGIDQFTADVEQRVRDASAALEELLDLTLYREPAPVLPFNHGREDPEVLKELFAQRVQAALRSALPASEPAAAPWSNGKASNGNGSMIASYLSLKVCVAAYQNVRKASEAVLRSLPKPGASPPQRLWDRPIWTTWARYKAEVNQKLCEDFGQEIVDKGFPGGVLEVDDRWQQKYGDTHFDPDKFPAPREMVDRLHELGFKVTVWVMPFFEEASEAYQEAKRLGHLIRSAKEVDSEPALIQTWLLPKVGVLDVTNPAAVEWFVERLKALQAEVGLDGYKFDAGEPCFLPFGCHTHRPLRHPAEFTHLYVTRVAKAFPFGEVRSGFLTQQVPMFTRMGDKFSSFSINNGLASLIPTLLTSGILGYPFVLPDMVGGNAYFLDMPSKELVVRWTQANALMPAIQFSIAPWNLREGSWWLARLLDKLFHPFRDEAAEAAETCECTLAALDVRERLSGRMAELLKASASTLEPICKPLWWLSPEDPETYAVNDQFLVGDDLLVCPQIEEGHGSRDIYLPAGSWRRADVADAAVETGSRWLHRVPTALSTLPVYERVG